MANFGWSYPAGCNGPPEEPEPVFDPACSRCHGEGVYDIDIQSQEGGSPMSVPQDCDCWESYDPGDCDPRHEYNYEDRE